jgi:hypothetical protein
MKVSKEGKKCSYEEKALSYTRARFYRAHQSINEMPAISSRKSARQWTKVHVQHSCCIEGDLVDDKGELE